MAATPPRRSEVAVSYGVEAMPNSSDVVYGGAVKFSLLDREFPNAPRDFNVLYLGSSSMPIDAPKLVRLARRRSARFVWNQNGVAYRGWYGGGWELVNRPRAALLHEADYVLYQSDFCKLAADRFYGARVNRYEVLHNPVDTVAFAPQSERIHRPLTLLLGGSQYQRYRVERAIEALSLIRRERRNARLIVAGELSFAPEAARDVQRLVDRFDVSHAVEFIGPYKQIEAPSLFHRADLLLHPKYNDPCPTVVLEAMASGLPVIYSESGGTPELVGGSAGIGIPAPLDWDCDHPPDSGALAEAALALADDLEDRAMAARDRARRFDVRAWIARHHALFEELVGDA
jgi:glycosyltransferase involved in cell wall biosynthesis